MKINEFSSNNPDFVELFNTGSGPVDLSGWVLKDNSENNSYTFPAGSSIAAGEYKVLNGESVDFVFGLGNGDSVRLFGDSDLTTPLDSSTYPAHPAAGTSYGRCPNATGPFEVTAAATKGAANRCAVPAGGENLKINEVQSDPGDRVELTNIGETTVDISGYVLKDNDDTHAFTVPAGTSLARTRTSPSTSTASFGLGKGDSVRLYQPNLANLLDSTTYPAGTARGRRGPLPRTAPAPSSPRPSPSVGQRVRRRGAAEPAGRGHQRGRVQRRPGRRLGRAHQHRRLPGRRLGLEDPRQRPGARRDPGRVPAGTTIAPGAFYAIYTEIPQSPGFGLGATDSSRCSWPTARPRSTPTRGRRTPRRRTAAAPTAPATSARRRPRPAARSNACSPVRINEVESSGGTRATGSSWSTSPPRPSTSPAGRPQGQRRRAHLAFPAGDGPAKGYLVVERAPSGSSRARRLGAPVRRRRHQLVDPYTWTAPPPCLRPLQGRRGRLQGHQSATKGAVNACPGLETAPWPGGQTRPHADLTDTFVQDLCGLAFDPADPDVLWASQNKLGTLFKLTRDEHELGPGRRLAEDPTYPDGTGAPDTEGITIGPDGFVYLASERNNAASGVSRMSILRYDPTATGTTLKATDEWNLTSQIPAAGANLGLEGVTWVPDSYLVAGGFIDQSTDAAYDPSSYPSTAPASTSSRSRTPATCSPSPSTATAPRRTRSPRSTAASST